jgi:hypothetical protein
MPESDNNTIEIISFDIPFPADYGGVIDVFYKIRAFNKAGIKVNLHCFEYGRKPAVELTALCNNVYYYKRNVSKANLIKRKPYIVASRSSEDLLINLCKTQNPILFEGLHSCFFLDSNSLSGRKKVVRTHNIEHDYYQCLARAEKDLFKRYYFSNESQKLKRFEKVLSHADGIAAISVHDTDYFLGKFRNVRTISAFHPHENVCICKGKGDFVLYHGSLGVAENNMAALFLINNVFSKINVPLIIAGNKPSPELCQASSAYSNITLKTGISTGEIYELVRNAQINILPTFQATGIKLKLLSALFSGRHCIVNQPMVANTGLEQICIVRDNENEIIGAVKEYFNKPFTEEEIASRKQVLEKNIFSNQRNIDQLATMLVS